MVDNVHFHVLWRDTRNRVATLRRAVNEGKLLQEAADFARYVLNSVAPLLAVNPQGDPLPCDGHLLRQDAQALLSAVQDRWRTCDTKPAVDLSELQAINRKLDLLAGHVARLQPMPPSEILPFPGVRAVEVPPVARQGDGGASRPLHLFNT